jgi:hypothetical protein
MAEEQAKAIDSQKASSSAEPAGVKISDANPTLEMAHLAVSHETIRNVDYRQQSIRVCR